MRTKGLLSVFVVILACFMLMGTALADYGYTEVSQIPMAVDFSVRVEFDDAGFPHIVTDYPFESTGATQMNLTYNKGDIPEAITLQYRYPSGTTSVSGYNGKLYDNAHLGDAYRAIRNGDLTLDDRICINTSRFSSETDWFLVYSADAGHYVEYTERTHAQAFNAMGSGGVAKSVYYIEDRINTTSVAKRIDDADLVVERDMAGDITSAYIAQYSPDYGMYYYDQYTGLFDGHPITELGFEESDLEIKALAAMGDRTGDVITSVSVEPDLPVIRVTERSSFKAIGGLLAGIMIGITLYYLFRRRKGKAAENKVLEDKTDGSGTAGSSSQQEETFDTSVKSIQGH